MYGLYKFLHKSVGLGCEGVEGGLIPRPISAVVPKNGGTKDIGLSRRLD